MVSLLAIGALEGCKNPCKDQLDSLKDRVMQFVNDIDPIRKGAQPCGTDEGSGNYDQICDYAMRALSTDWPYFDCNSCDATEIMLCGCFGDDVWVVDQDRNPIYPGMVYCLANYYRTRNLCACNPDFPGDQGNPKDCYVTGGMISPAALEIPGDGVDENCDGTDPSLDCKDKDGDLYYDIQCGGSDCNDANPSVHPFAVEICGDEIDQDCVGGDLPCSCLDADGDSYFDQSCGGNDCDDADARIHPGANEFCGDGIDQDCNGLDLVCCPDLDRDGFKDHRCGGDDCDDDDADTYPGAQETRGDGIDQDCNGFDLATVCPDVDDDDHDDANCGGTDCDDADPTIYPGAGEIPDDGIDQDCNGSDLPLGCPDDDGDGQQAEYCGGTDCNDAHPGVYTGADEICGNGIDDDCNGADLAPCDCPDADRDRFHDASCGGSDCDDQAVIRICAQPEKPQVKQHTLQQTDVCDRLVDSFGCIYYDGDYDRIPDQYDGGADRMTQYLAEDAECPFGPPGKVAWDEWFTSPRSLYDGGKIFTEWDEGYPEDQDEDGVSDTCDNCIDLPNGFFCQKKDEKGRQPFLLQCDANRDGIVGEDELSRGNQRDGDYERSIALGDPVLGDACDHDMDGLRNEVDNCPDNANGLECLAPCRPTAELAACDANEDGELALDDLNSLDQNNPAELQRCIDLLNQLPRCQSVFKCDANLDGAVNLTELKWGNQADTEWPPDGVGNACDNCPGTFNPGQEDSDGDGIGDACE